MATFGSPHRIGMYDCVVLGCPSPRKLNIGTDKDMFLTVPGIMSFSHSACCCHRHVFGLVFVCSVSPTIRIFLWTALQSEPVCLHQLCMRLTNLPSVRPEATMSI